MLSFEILLVLGVAGFYLYDSAQLLYANELVFVKKEGKWDFVYPGSSWRLIGKSLYLPNPLTPDNAEFRVYWSAFEEKAGKTEECEFERFFRALPALQFGVALLFFFLFVALPLVLFLYGTGFGLLIIFAFSYLNIIVVLVLAYQRRADLGVSGRQLVSIVMESILCAPFALNIVRKISQQHSFEGDPIKFARNVFDKNTFNKLVDEVCEKLDERLLIEEPEGSRYLALQSYRNQILGMKQ